MTRTQKTTSEQANSHDDCQEYEGGVCLVTWCGERVVGETSSAFCANGCPFVKDARGRVVRHYDGDGLLKTEWDCLSEEQRLKILELCIL